MSAELLDSSDGSVAADDYATIEVDLVTALQDSDCYTTDCRDTYCDPTTSHCAPDIIAFTPNNTTIRCYFQWLYHFVWLLLW